MPTVYPPLAIGAPTRLALFKREAASPNWVRSMTWRDVRFATLASPTGMDRGLNGDVPVWVSFEPEGYFRSQCFADEIEAAGIDHKGWFTDEDEETARGIVASLPHGRFIAGYQLSMNDECVYFARLFDDAGDAARMADEHARVIAEGEREYSERWQAAHDLDNKIDNALTRLRTIRREHSRFIDARECCMGGPRRHEARAHWHMKAAEHRIEATELIETVRITRDTLACDYSDVV